VRRDIEQSFMSYDMMDSILTSSRFSLSKNHPYNSSTHIPPKTDVESVLELLLFATKHFQ
jgi:hypothetical protein